MLFPEWIIEQYNLQMHALNGFVYLGMRRAVWGLPQAGILANKLLHRCLPQYTRSLEARVETYFVHFGY
jgi:hypothetical protein